MAVCFLQLDIVELLARVETVLRRYGKGKTQVEIGDVTVDYEARTVTKNRRPVSLTAKEFGLLTLFIQNKDSPTKPGRAKTLWRRSRMR